MRYLARTHGVNIASLHERTTANDCRMYYTESKDMAADIFTKFFPSSKQGVWDNVRKT